MVILKGQPMVARLAFGNARIAARPRRTWRLAAEHVNTAKEEDRLDKAIRKLRERLRRTFEIATAKIGEVDAQIFEVHRQMLEDPDFQEEIRLRIRRDKSSAERAVQAAIDVVRGRYARSHEDKIRFMAAELAGLGEDLVDELTGDGRPESVDADGPIIDFVSEVTPRMVMRAEAENVAGFVAHSGGRTAHATILARALELPMVANVPEARTTVRNGDRVILDGTAGTVIVNPNVEKEEMYRDMAERLRKARSELLANRDLPAVTRDGCRIVLHANIALTAETEAVERFGGEGIGLYRSELSYLLRNQYPSEEELVEIYRTLGERLGAVPLTVRTLDIGAEKTPAYFGIRPAANPLLGLRSLRLLATHREVLQTQFRAILRASMAMQEIRVMFPLIGSIEEWREACAAFAKAREELNAAGHPFKENIPLGLMIEVPSAALSIRDILRESDFASVGTNDLTQYLFGVDRSDSTVARFYQPISPPMLELIHRAASVGHDAAKPVSLCGEIAGDPQFTALLIGLGIRTLSMNPEAIPQVKDRVRQLELPDCEQLARTAMTEVSVEGILKQIATLNSQLAHR